MEFVRDKRGRYQEASDVFAGLAGMSPGELVGKTDLELPWPDISEALLKDDQRVLGGEVSCVQTLLHTDNGWRITDSEKWRDSGYVRGWVKDTTEGKRVAPWLKRFDMERDVLALGSGIDLSRRDCRLLHLYLNGATNKELSKEIHLTTRGVEWALGLIREKMNQVTGLDCRGSKLMRALHHDGLSIALLMKEDFFDRKPAWLILK